MEKSAVELTQELIRFDTINPPGNELACAELLAGLLAQCGFDTQLHRMPGSRANLVARGGGSPDKPPICFTGHIDTVPLGRREWSIDPFAAEIAGGKLYGRGSSDMKSGVAAFCLAAAEMVGRLEGTAGVVLVITAGEETGCDGAYSLAAKAGALGSAGAVVVAEPTSNAPWVGHKGALWLRAVSTGVTAHGSMPEKGENAVYRSARAITKLEEFGFNVARHAVLGGPTLNVGTVKGGMNINSVPDHAEFTIDLRTVPGQDHAQLREQLSSYLGEEVELETLVDVPGVWTEPELAWMQEVYAIAKRVTGRETPVAAASYFTDASVLTPSYGNPPTVVLGPGQAEMAHQTDEYCYVDKLDEAVAVYRELTRAWCGV